MTDRETARSMEVLGDCGSCIYFTLGEGMGFCANEASKCYQGNVFKHEGCPKHQTKEDENKETAQD